MKRKQMSRKASAKMFKRSGQMMNSNNQPKISRGCIRF